MCNLASCTVARASPNLVVYGEKGPCRPPAGPRSIIMACPRRAPCSSSGMTSWTATSSRRVCPQPTGVGGVAPPAAAAAVPPSCSTIIANTAHDVAAINTVGTWTPVQYIYLYWSRADFGRRIFAHSIIIALAVGVPTTKCIRHAAFPPGSSMSR